MPETVAHLLEFLIPSAFNRKNLAKDTGTDV